MYVPLDVNFPDDDRIVEIDLAATGLYAQALCIAKRLQRDGLVPRRALTRLLDDPHETGPLDALEEVGLIEKVQVDAGDAGTHAGRIMYRICGWSKHNASDAQKSDRGRHLAHQRHHVKTGNPNPSCELCFPEKPQVDAEICEPQCEPHATDDAARTKPSMPEVEVEVDVEVEENTRASADSQALAIPVPDASPSATVSESWERFWSAYPKKVGKQAARKAWDRARKRRPADEIQAALDAHLPAWSTIDVQFVPNPATWLGQGRYEDPPPKPRSGPAKPNRIDENMAKIQRSMQRMAAS